MNLPSYKTIKLTQDDLLMGFKQGDELIVKTSSVPEPGSLVVTHFEGAYQVCRYECIEGKTYLWPPRTFTPDRYSEVILGQAIELNRTL